MSHDFLPLVRQTEDGCTITVPHASLRNPAGRTHTSAISVKRGRELSGLEYSTPVDKGFLPCPEYGVRGLIQTVLDYRCRSVPIDPRLTRFEDLSGQEVSGLSGVIGEPSTEDECRREGLFLDLFALAIESGFDPKYDSEASRLGLGEGFTVCKNYYK